MTPKVALRALILEDRPEDAALMVRALGRSGFDPQWERVETEAEFLARLEPPPDVILADYTLPELNAPRALDLLKERGLQIPFIVVSGTIGEDQAVAMIRLGAADYLLKDRLMRLGAAVKHALMARALRQDKVRAEEELETSELRFEAFMRHSPVLAFINDEAGRVLYVNNASPDAAEVAVQLRVREPLEQASGRRIDEVTTAEGQRQMLSFRFLFQDAAGRKLLGGVSADITEQKAAERALSEALAAKDVLLRELHHRVKNNLQTVSSLLHMQAELLPNNEASEALREAQRRVHSMALIHEQMYGDERMGEVDFSEYARRLTRDLVQSFGESGAAVQTRFALEPVTLPMDQMIPCGLILNEWITNALKYAFPGGRTGEILVSLSAGGGVVSMGVADDGVGLPPDVNTKQPGSLGRRIVEILVRQLGGTLEQHSAGGVTSTVTFMRSGKA